MIKHTRLSIGIITLLAIFFSIFRRKANKPPQRVERVLGVYLTGNLGDMIFTTPVFRALKKEKPECYVQVLGQQRNAETLKYNPDIDEYIAYPDSLYGLWKQFRRLRPDYAFLFLPTAFEIATLFLAGVPAIVIFTKGDKSSETKTVRLLKYLCIQVPFKGNSNFAVENLKLLTPLGIHSQDTKKHLYYSSQAENTITQFLTEKELTVGRDILVAMAPGAGTKIKQWPAEHFAAVADHIYNRLGVSIFIVGGPNDSEEYEKMKAAVQKDTKLVSCLHHSIDELKAFGSMLNIMIANDSAPIYVAEAFGKATVTIVGPTNEAEHPPQGRCHAVVTNADRGVPALTSRMSRKKEFDDAYARRQIEEVKVEQVTEAVDSLLNDKMCIK